MAEKEGSQMMGGLEKLLDEMPSQAPLLRRIVEECRTQKSVASVNAIVRAHQEAYEVYDGPCLCRLLEQAGALDHIAVEGSRDAEEVVDDERLFLRPARQMQTYWRSTPEALDYLDSFDPGAPIRALRDAEGQAWHLYKHALAFVGTHEGCVEADIEADLNAFEPYREMSPRVTCAHLLDKAQRAGAIEWENGGWALTAAGGIVTEREVD